MTDDLYDAMITPPALRGGDPYGDLWEAFWADFDAREAEKARGTRQVLVSDELGARNRARSTASFEAQSCAEQINPAFHADLPVVAYNTTKPFLTTREAAAYCGFRTAGVLRKAKLEGEMAVSRTGGANQATSSCLPQGRSSAGRTEPEAPRELPGPSLLLTADETAALLHASHKAICANSEMRRRTTNDAAPEELPAMLALVDELASLAADLWFAGKLDHFSLEEEPPDGD